MAGWLALAPAQDPAAILRQATDDFLAGRLEASVEAFDRVAELSPETAPYLWQRGIALYYAGRYDDCRAQFESHRTVNPNDVENAAWHFLCVARLESPQAARRALLPVGPDRRAPMAQIYEMYRGERSAADLLSSTGDAPLTRFYAYLYVGLYLEADGRVAEARDYVRRAAADEYGVGGYMHRVARLHLEWSSR